MNKILLKILNKRLDESKSEKYHRPFVGPRRKLFGIHFYRPVGAMKMDWGWFDRLLDEPNAKNKKKKRPYEGPTFHEWETRVGKVVPWQLWFRWKAWPEFKDYFQLFEIYSQDWLPDDRDEWSWLDYPSAVELNYDNKLFKKLRSFKIHYLDNQLRPFNVVKIKTLSKHYADEEQILIHSMFQIFCDFIERHGDQRGTYPVEIHDGVDVNAVWRKWHEDAMDLYQWWQRREQVDDEWYQKTKKLDRYAKNWATKYRKIEEAQAKEMEDRLIQLIKLRKGLWD